ncbi:MAG: hypothetical protein Q4B80_01710 [Aerococcaceae bacterium]|nr:hypothetical protein [Aerococcaceae bacterium]
MIHQQTIQIILSILGEIEAIADVDTLLTYEYIKKHFKIDFVLDNFLNFYGVNLTLWRYNSYSLVIDRRCDGNIKYFNEVLTVKNLDHYEYCFDKILDVVYDYFDKSMQKKYNALSETESNLEFYARHSAEEILNQYFESCKDESLKKGYVSITEAIDELKQKREDFFNRMVAYYLPNE